MKTKTQFTNRILSFVLCFVMVMTILPSAPMHVHATEVSESAPVCTCAEACTAENANEYCDVCGIDYSACTGTDTAAAYEDAVTLPRFLYVGGVEVISEYNVGAVTSGTGWRYDTATATLYLTDGADIRYSSTTEDSLENGIYCSGGTLKVHASGTVSITGYGDGIRLPDGSLDLYAAEDANVTITGTSAGSEGINSTVNTNSIRFSGKGTVNVNASDGASYGMTAAGSIYIDGVTLNVRGASNYDDISGANVLIGQTEGAVVNCLGTTCSGIGGTLTQKLGIYNGSIVHLAEKTTEKSWLLGFHAKTIEIADSTVVMDGLTGAYSIYAMHGTSAVSGDSHILIRKMVSTEDGAYGLTVGYDPYQLTGEAGYYTRSDAAAEFTADGDITEIYIGYFELCTASHYRYHSNGDGTHYYGCSAACPVAIKGENEACGGTVTCKELAVCEICGATHGELLPHTPVADSYQDSGEGKHSYTCAVCGTVTEGHKWVDGICTDCKAVCAHDHHEDGVCTACGVVCTHESYENGECTVCGSACVHDFDSVGLCNICDLRKVWLKTSSWEEPTIFCSDTSMEIPMTKDTETGLWYGYVPKTLEGFIFRRLYTNPYSGETFYHQTEQLSLPEDANSYRVKGSTSTDKDETYTYYTYDGNWYLHPCTEHTWESGECSKCGLVCSHTGGEATCTSQAICETCGSGYGEKLAHNFYDYTGRCWVCNEFLAVLQETRGGASTYYTLDQIASGKTFGYGGTLTLHANIRMEAGVSLELGLSDFILDLNGYRLFAVDTHAVKVAGNLTILDSSADGGGYLEGYNIDSRDSTTSAVYGEGNNFHVTVLGDVKLFGVKTFLSGKSSDDVSGGVFDLTQWNHVAGSTIYITHETSTVYDSVLLPTGYALVDTDALVVWPGATVKENKALTVTECTTHAGGTASCAEQAKCEICGASYGQLDPDNHSINAEGDKPATCKDKAYCSVCKSEYGELDADNHASEEFTYIANEDGTTHKKMHKCCGKTASEAEPHTFDVTTGKCTACGTKRPAVVVAAPVANEKKIRFNGEDLPDGLMYNGGDQELIVPGTAEGGTMVYSLDLNGEFTETVPTAKDAGTYTVYYKVLGDETHADTDVASVTITMEKAPAIMSPTEQTHCMYYDCSDLPTGMRNCDLPNYDGYAIPDPNVDLIYTTNAVQGVEGEYTIFISGPAEDKNYIYTYENGTLILTDHIFNSFTGKCECGEEMAVASTTVDNITIYYLTVQEALDAAAQAESAVVELLRSDENVTGLTMFSGNVRLVMNGWTLKGNVNNNGILQLFGAELTVDGGTIENTAQDGYGVYAAYNDDTHRYSTISLIGSDIIGINAGICTYKAHVEVADSTVTGTEYGIHAQKSGAVTLESGTISGKIGVQTSIYGGTLYMGAEGTSSGPTINGQTYGVYHMSHMYAYAGTINCPAGIGVLLSEHHTNQNESEGAGLYLMGLPTINAATDIYVDYLANQRDKRCIQVYVELPEGAYSVDSTNEYEVIAIPGEGIKLNRTWFTSVDENKFVQYNDLGYLYLGPCAHGEKRGVQNEDDLTHDIWCDICLTTPEEDVACSGGTATCTSQAICEVCGELYGTKNADNHTGALGTPKPTADGAKHVATWSCCGAIGETEDHTMDTATGKCVCGLETAVAKVTSGGVDTYYETLMEALTVAGNGDTVTLCKSVDIDTTRHTIPEGVTFQGGEYTVSSEDASWVENNGTIASGKFTFIVENNGMVVGGEFRTLINSGTVQGGSFESIDCDSGSSLLGPVSITGHLFYGGECTIDLSNATFGDRSFLANKTDSDLAVSILKLPEGYAVEYDGAVVSVLPAWETGNIVSHTHTYETVFSSTHHWTQCACGKATAEVEHSYTYSNDGRSTHTVGCTGCTYTDTQSHTYLADTHKCICGNVEKFMVTWSNGDGGSYEKEYAFGTVITVPTSEIFQETVRKTGYHLTGWEGYTEGMTMPAEALTFTAQYTPIEYTITWEMNGCTYELSNYHQLPKKLAYNVDSYQHNVNFFHITPPSGYAFVCFVDGNGNELETNSSDLYRLLLTVSGDMTVKAVIEPETYMATWTTGDGDNYEKEFKYGETITIPDNEFFRDTFRKTGYTLTGWEGYTEGMTMPVDGITFTAIYQANEYTITFDTDGGSAVAPITQAYGTQIVAPAAPAKDGSHFVKWENLPETVPAGDLTVKAVWEAHYGGEATCVSGKLCQVCTAEYTAVDANAHGALLYTVSQDGATCTVSCSLCQKVLETLTLLKPACKTYGDGKSCEVAVLVNDVLVTDISDQVYFRWENGQWNKLEAAPTNAGTYRAEIYNVGDPYDTADDFTLYVEYTIAKAKLTITAEDNTITYGDAPAANGVTGNGFVGSDSFTDLSGELTYSYNYEQFGNVGTYRITPAGLTSDNYAITFADGTLTVNAKAITVTADALSKTYGDTDPTLTYKVEGLVNGDELTGELKRVAGENVGSYAIEQNTLTVGNNYSITYTGAKLTINKRSVTVTAKDQTLTYGETISGTEITANGLVDGHSVTVTLTPSTANVTVDGTITASAAIITAGTADVTANYEITYAGGKLVIEPDMSKIAGLTTDNVTSANEADIKAVQEMMAKADSVKDEWAAISTTCEDLIEKIEAVEAQKKEATDKAVSFDADTVKSTDKANLTQLAEKIETLLDTDNLTEDERTALETVLEQVNGMIDTIEDTAEDSKAATDAIDALDAATVTSDDKDELEQAIETIEDLLAGNNLTEEERKALEDAQADAKALIDVINAAAGATDTENTEKVEDVTPENVTPEDKTDLEKAKADLEKALEDNGGNYTEDEKKVIQEEIDRIDSAITALENVENVTEAIAQLPESVEPDNEAEAEKILATKEGYDALTDHEKSLVSEDAKKKLEDLVASLTAYDIVKGDGSSWTEDSNGTISFTANGAFSKFVGIKVDGVDVDKANYEAKAGSTIITLKASYLDTLKVGEHTITVVYNDGSTDGTFKIVAKPNTPATGDDFNIALYGSLMAVSVTALVVLLLASKKRKYAK